MLLLGGCHTRVSQKGVNTEIARPSELCHLYQTFMKAMTVLGLSWLELSRTSCWPHVFSAQNLLLLWMIPEGRECQECHLGGQNDITGLVIFWEEFGCLIAAFCRTRVLAPKAVWAAYRLGASLASCMTG